VLIHQHDARLRLLAIIAAVDDERALNISSGGVASMPTATVETPGTDAIFSRICLMYEARASRD